MSVLNKLKTKFSKWLNSPILLLILFLKLGVTIGIFYCFYWMGLKGIIGFILGMTIMCIVLFTNNPIAMMFIRMFQGKVNIYNLMKGEVETDEEKTEDYIEVGR